MKRTLSLLLKNKFWFITCLFFVSVLACSPKEEQNEELTKPEGSANPDQIILNREQFETSLMELGKIQDYSFGSSLKINGMVDVPPESQAEISSYYGGYVR